jgi:hypothetical protein
MRALALAVVLALSAGSAALAAPTCLDAVGRTVRCGTPGAGPVGWTPAPEVMADHRAALPAGPDQLQWFGLACFLGGLMALFALLPDFENGQGGGWDPREDDDA